MTPGAMLWTDLIASDDVEAIVVVLSVVCSDRYPK